VIWSSLNEFILMHGYGGYVWGSFGLTALLMALEFRQLRKINQTIFSENPPS
jgi:heme exporter protein D